jgi:hypothetical protein
LFRQVISSFYSKKAKVIEMTVREESKWVWDLKWKRDLFKRGLVILGELLQALESSTFSEGVVFWVWINDSWRIYSVR